MQNLRFIIILMFFAYAITDFAIKRKYTQKKLSIYKKNIKNKI